MLPTLHNPVGCKWFFLAQSDCYHFMFEEFSNLSNYALMRLISKLLFPNLSRDQQRRRMGMLVITLLTAFGVGGLVAVTILLMNKR